MFEDTLVMYIYTETPIHTGSGVALGTVDLPIQRERHTDFPLIQGASLKGVLRHAFESQKNDENKAKEIFGDQDKVGGIAVTDARILAFPVRTLKGVFGWITCPLVLDRYKRDLKIAGLNVNWEVPQLENDSEVIVCKDSNLKVNENIYIEDLQLKCSKHHQEVKNIAKCIAKKCFPADKVYTELKEKLKKDLVIVSDDIFRDLVSLTTEVVTRIKIDPATGTVETGGLWTEEYLPTDTIMYSLILIPKRTKKSKNGDSSVKETILSTYDGKILQVGGDETIGKGFVRAKLVDGGAKNGTQS